MPKPVVYEISLKDILSGQIKHAEGNVNHFEHTVEHSRDLIKEMTGAAAGFFGLYQGVEFVKSSVEAYNNVEKSLSQLRAGLESTHGAAGVTYEELTEGAERFAASTIYNKETLLDMQAQLLSFPEVTKETFADAEQAIMDLATRTGHSLHDVSIMVGKALGDPTKGITALRRVGVEFSQSQTEVIKKLAETGHVAQAQKMILKELSREYAGSTAAASATDGGKLEILKHQFDEVKESIGKLVMEETIKLAPTIKELIGDTKHFVEWLDKNKDSIIEVGKAIGEITIAMWAFGKAGAAIEATTALWETLSAVVAKVNGGIEATAAAETTAAAAGATGAGTTAAASAGTTAATSEVAAASVVGAGGMVIGAAAVFAMAAGVYEFYQKYLSKITNYLDGKGGVSNEDLEGEEWLKKNRQEEAEKKEKSDISALQHSTSYTFNDKKFRKDIMLGMMPEDVRGHYEEAYSSIKHDTVNGKQTAISKISEADFAKYVSSNAELQKAIVSMSDLDRQHIFEILDKLVKPGKSGKTSTGATLSDMQSSVTGQNVKNYNIRIENMIREFTVKAATVKEAAPDIKRVVTEAMTDAINDSEVNN